jgi:hypothetical protein
MNDDEEPVSHELSAREDAWVFWPPPGTHTIATGECCRCGHEGLPPQWHTNDCPALAYIWRNRARQLHDQLWDMWEHICRGGAVDCTTDTPAIWSPR